MLAFEIFVVPLNLPLCGDALMENACRALRRGSSLRLFQQLTLCGALAVQFALPFLAAGF